MGKYSNHEEFNWQSRTTRIEREGKPYKNKLCGNNASDYERLEMYYAPETSPRATLQTST